MTVLRPRRAANLTMRSSGPFYASSWRLRFVRNTRCISDKTTTRTGNVHDMRLVHGSVNMAVSVNAVVSRSALCLATPKPVIVPVPFQHLRRGA